MRVSAPARTALFLLLAICLGQPTVQAGSHFLHYRQSGNGLQALPEKFDLSALSDKTVRWFVWDAGPETYSPNDSFASLVSQLRLAANAWNGVPSSDLRLEFGGFYSPGTPNSTPGVEVLFDELPPGLVAMAGPETRLAAVENGEDSFVPILRSILVLPRDMESRASYSENFFLTLVHEFGHTLGLQHTLTSSVMSTFTTRGTTRAKPLADDDVAGLSALYPNAAFRKITGGISGKVMVGGQAAHLASVVAISPGGLAISALTDPGGNYRLTGLAPGQYYLYVHPLPPAQQTGMGPADLVLPRGADGEPVSAGPVFYAQFYPGATTIEAAQPVAVEAGSEKTGFNFQPAPSEAQRFYHITTYSFPGGVAVKPAFLNIHGRRKFLVASGYGLATRSGVPDTFSVNVIGGSASVRKDGLRLYSPAPDFLQVDFEFNPFSTAGMRHLMFSAGRDLYVLPAGITLVSKDPPSIDSAIPETTPGGAPVVRIKGANLTAKTRIFFDGFAARIRSFDSEAGELVVEPPPGLPGHIANLIATEPDGQSSLFLQQEPFNYEYPSGEVASVDFSPKQLPAGVEAMVEVSPSNINILRGENVLGFGSHDVIVRRVFTLDSGKMLANVSVRRAAEPGDTTFSLTNGFTMLYRPFAFKVAPRDPELPVLNPTVLAQATGFPSLYPGSAGILEVSNLPAGANENNVQLFLDDRQVSVARVENGKVVFAIPGNAPEGPAVLKLLTRGKDPFPVAVSIDPLPPSIIALMNESGEPVRTSGAARLESTLTLRVARLGKAGESIDPARVEVRIAGVPHRPSSIETIAGGHAWEFAITTAAAYPGDGPFPITVYVDGRPSLPLSIQVH